MKKLILVAFALCFGILSVFSQDDKNSGDYEIKTILGKQKGNGGYGALSFGYAPFNDKGLIMAGARGEWVINHALGLGIGGVGITSNLYMDGIMNNDTVRMDGGYGGFYVEPVLMSRYPVHFAFPVLIGAGAFVYSSGDYVYNNEYWQRRVEDYDLFVIIEPGIELEANVTKFFRIALGGTYRILKDVNLVNTSADAFNGPSGYLTFKFGRF